jgi:hypothetical protein
MWHVRSLSEAKTILAGIENVAVIHSPGRTKREVVDAYERAHGAAQRLRIGSNLQPLVERATLVRFKVTEANPTYGRWIDHGRDRLEYCREQQSHSGMKQQRFFIPNQELIEL